MDYGQLKGPPLLTGLTLEVPATVFSGLESWSIVLGTSWQYGGMMSQMMEQLKHGPVAISVTGLTGDRCLLRLQSAKVGRGFPKTNLFVSNAALSGSLVVTVPDARLQSLRNGPRLERIFVYSGSLMG